MKYSLSLGLIATAFFTVVAGDACELESDLQTRVETVTTTTTTENGTAAVFQPVAVVGLNKTSVARVVPSVDLPLLPYGSNTSDIVIGVNHTMKYPSVLLEGIASVSSVDCSETSVAITFNDSSIFAATQVEWSNGTLILVTNHMGDCDAEAERGFFLVDSLVWNTTSLVATATSSKTDVNSTAGKFRMSCFWGGANDVQPSPRSFSANPPRIAILRPVTLFWTQASPSATPLTCPQRSYTAMPPT